jgi:hypothetical protein
MTVSRHLLAGRFDAWIGAAMPPPLWLFVHVPKTAGSSLGTELATVLKPYCNIHIDGQDRRDRSRTVPERYDNATKEFLAAHARKPFRFASGHVQFRHVRCITEAVPGTRLFTMLREPVSRLVSDYLYQRSPMHPLADEVRKTIPDFAAFIELKGQRNRIARHLVPPKLVAENDVTTALDMLGKRFAFIGIQERYELGFRALTALLTGTVRRPAAEPKRVNEAAKAEKAEVMRELEDPALRARIAELNAFDLGVHAALAADWDRIAAPLEAWLNAREGAVAA